jgi:hypothetical protein
MTSSKNRYGTQMWQCRPCAVTSGLPVDYFWDLEYTEQGDGFAGKMNLIHDCQRELPTGAAPLYIQRHRLFQLWVHPTYIHGVTSQIFYALAYYLCTILLHDKKI